MLTIEKVEKAMLEGVGQSFTTIYLEELRDCIPDLTEFIKKKTPGGLTEAMMKRNGYRRWETCLCTAPSMTSTFGRLVLDAWVRYFFEDPDLMELVGIIAEQENPGADQEVIKEMKDLKMTGVVAKSEEKGPLTGLHIVFTGASEYFTGEAMERFLEKNGAITSHTVTNKIDVLVTGARPASSKVAKAGRLGIPVMKESDFYKHYNLIGSLPRMR